MTQREIGLIILAAALALLFIRASLIAGIRGARLRRLMRELE